ncbi:hypothetical protein [Desulfosarcina sp.]|uniref:hypothetical protein n=1 Tax=Desulfosarcina sp. TaxID=2027861 RepID=UPI003970FE16
MIDRIDHRPTPRGFEDAEERSGKERRKVHTMLDPKIDKRKGDRRNKKGNAR